MKLFIMKQYKELNNPNRKRNLNFKKSTLVETNVFFIKAHQQTQPNKPFATPPRQAHWPRASMSFTVDTHFDLLHDNGCTELYKENESLS